MKTQMHSETHIMANIMNNKEILLRFNSTIDEITTQFQKLGLNNIVHNIKELIDNQEKLLEIINNLINEVKYSQGQNQYSDFNAYIQALISKFSINEQCIIVAHFNLNQETYLLEDIEFLVYEFLYQNVRQKLMDDKVGGV